MNNQQLFQNYGLRALQIIAFVFVILIIQSTATGQTAFEQQCFNAVQGKVAYDQAGHKSWSPANIEKLCQATTDPSATIACFERQIRQHNDWNRGIETCKASAVPKQKIILSTNPTPAKTPAPINNVPAIGSNGKGGFEVLTKGIRNDEIPPGCREYDIQIRTGIPDEADSDGDVFITIHGTHGTTGEINISEHKYQKNYNAPGSCQFGNSPVQYVRFNETKQIVDQLIANAPTKTYARNSTGHVTVNANDVGQVTAVGVRTDKGSYYLSYLKIKSGDEYKFSVEKWFSARNVSEIFRVIPKFSYGNYRIKINTGDLYLAGTDANVYVTLEGPNGKVPEFNLKTYISGNPLERGKTDEFTLKDVPNVDPDFKSSTGVTKITIRSDLSGADADWFFNWIEVSGDGKEAPFTFANWVNKDNSSVSLTPYFVVRDGRTITFRNESGFMAKMMVQYFVDSYISGQKVSLPKVVFTPNMPVGQSSSIPIINSMITVNTKIQVFLIGTGTTNDNFYMTQVDWNFTGNQCFKAYNTFANPTGAKCE